MKIPFDWKTWNCILIEDADDAGDNDDDDDIDTDDNDDDDDDIDTDATTTTTTTTTTLTPTTTTATLTILEYAWETKVAPLAGLRCGNLLVKQMNAYSTGCTG